MLGGSLSSPVVIIATNKRVMMITRTLFGISEDCEIFHYKQIIGMRMIKGLLTSSLHIMMNGNQDIPGSRLHRSNSNVRGIYKNEGDLLMNFINKMMVKWHEAEHASKEVLFPVLDQNLLGMARK